MNQVSVQKRIEQLAHAVLEVDGYSDKCYSLLIDSYQLLDFISKQKEEILPYSDVNKLEKIINRLRRNIRKKENFEAVIKQVDF
ncbi:hypothetical protein [Rubrolithibacter danxiaensis]|uniref:hypothetical protein n=1 Tax=Rubrolithibacter danxiaensis TaxID=3390805 RepID=UPI003BF8EBE9